MSPKTLLNHFSAANKHMPDIMLECTRGGDILRCGPTMVRLNGESSIGFFEIFYPSDGGESEIKCVGVYNKPHENDPTKK
jgi:hypothetical protein